MASLGPEHLGQINFARLDSMWATLKQGELRIDLVKCKLHGSSSSGLKPKEEEENVALASKG